mgnify:CR=1 FL=1
MSKVCEIELIARNIADVQAMCAKLGHTLRQRGRLRWYRTQEGEECEYTIELSDSVLDKYERPVNKKYNIGLKRQPDGSYKLLHDNAMNGAEAPSADTMDETTRRVVGAVKQRLAVEAVRRTTARNRQRMVERVLADGTIQVDVYDTER